MVAPIKIKPGQRLQADWLGPNSIETILGVLCVIGFFAFMAWAHPA